MLLEKFGHDLVLLLQLLLQLGDLLGLRVLGAALIRLVRPSLKCGARVLKELLLPRVVLSRVNPLFVAQIRDRNILQ